MLARQWQFQSGTYWYVISGLAESSCFNAFSRVDMRVEVKIPGGVKTHAVDERGTKYDLPVPSINS